MNKILVLILHAHIGIHIQARVQVSSDIGILLLSSRVCKLVNPFRNVLVLDYIMYFKE